MKGNDGKPYREGGVWIRRVKAEPFKPKEVDRGPDKTQELDQNAHRIAGIRAILAILKANKVPPRRVLSKHFYPRRKHGGRK